MAADGSVSEWVGEDWPDDKYRSDIYHDLSPDGTRMVFTTYGYSTGFLWDRVHSLEIAVSALDGSDRRRLTKNKGYDALPVWSPDGSRIAFLSDRGHSEGSYHLFTMAPDGTDVQSLAPDVPTGYFSPEWSPDGGRIAFLGGDWIGNYEYRPIIHSVERDGANLTRLGETRSQPVWSPDGRRIAFERVVDGTVSLYTVDHDGGNPAQLTPSQPIDTSSITHRAGFQTFDVPWQAMAWSPDGTEIIYDSDILVHADGSGFRTLKGEQEEFQDVWDGGISYDQIAWSPDGSKIALTAYEDSTRKTVGLGLVTFNRDGSDRRSLAWEIADGLMLVTEGSSDVDLSSCSDGSAVLFPIVNRPLVKDCERLLRMRDTLAGGSRRLNWGYGDPMDEWNGISIGGFPPRVREIWGPHLYSDFGGVIPPEIGELTGLRSIRFKGTALNDSLTGPIPPELGNLTKLRELVIVKQWITGSIPPELGNLTKLKNLSFRYNYTLTGSIPSELGNLTKLEELELSDNSLSGVIPPELGNLTKLKYFTMGNNALTGSIPPELGNLVNVTEMALYGNSLSGRIPPALGNLPETTSISVRGNQLEGCIPASLSNHRRLGKLGVPEHLEEC